MILGTAAIIYVLLSSLIGVYYSRNVSTQKDFVLANRTLPLHISTATVFATWFGAESILYIPSAYMQNGLIGIISDPIGAFICILVIGLVFGRTFYNLNVMTIADFLRNRYGKAVEIILGFAIACSYMGWITAQFMAFGFMISFLSNDMIDQKLAIIICAFVIGLYTYRGGMRSIAVNDFVQTIMIIFGLVYIMLSISDATGGFGEVLNYAHHHDKLLFKDTQHYPNLYGVAGVIFAMILGTIPQQDTFQRISSAKDADTAVKSTILGGFVYLLVTLIPVFIVIAASKINFPVPGENHDNYELFLASFIVEYTPFPVQVLFFGALLAAVFSTLAGTTLAAGVIFSKNVISGISPNPKKELIRTKLSLIGCIIIGAYIATCTTASIHSLVENSGKITMVMAFAPLVFGLFWDKASSKGALFSSIGGGLTWIALEVYKPLSNNALLNAPEIIGLATAIVFMTMLSLLSPAKITKKKKK